MSKKTKQRRELYTTAKKFLDIHALFPKSKNVGRAPLTDYQQKKISREMRALAEKAGGMKFLERDFVPMKRTKGARDYLAAAGLPTTAKGVLISGGAKVNRNATIRGGVLFYNRGERGTAQFPLNAASEKTLRAGIRKQAGYIQNPDNSAYIATAGGKINNANYKRRGKYYTAPAEVDGEDEDALELLEELATTLHERYSSMAKAGEMRPNGRRAAHPSKWGMALVIERK